MRDDDEECALFHALYPVTGGAVTDAPRVTRTEEPVPIEVLGSRCAIGPIRSHCATEPRPNGTSGSHNAGRGSETLFGMFLFGHWIAHARVRGPYVDITFDPHSHEVAELLGAKPAPARLASLLALVLARCPYVARATRAREADLREERKGLAARKAREARKNRKDRKAREADRRDEGEAHEADRIEEAVSDSDDTELIMLTNLTGPSDPSGLTDLPSVGLSDLMDLSNLPSVGLAAPSDLSGLSSVGLSDLARTQVAVFSSHGSRGLNGPHGPHGPRGAVCPNGPNGPNDRNGLTGAMGANGASAKWARVVSWDTDSLARLSFHVDVRIIII